MSYKNLLNWFYWLECYYKIIISLIIASLGPILGIIGLILPAEHRFTNVQQQEIQLKQQYQSHFLQFLNSAQLKRQQYRIQQQSNRQLIALTHPLPISTIMSKLDQTIRLCHLTRIAMKPNELQAVNAKLSKQTIWFSLHGSDQHFIRWLWLLAQQPWAISIDEYNLTKEKAGIAINLKLSIYYD